MDFGVVGRNTMKKGFTLMELLIVIALIGILVTMGVASYSTAQIKSRDTRRRSDMKVIQNAFEQYYSENNGDYPSDDTVKSDSTYFPGGFPKDPKPAPYEQYSWSPDATGASYCLCALQETDESGNASAACGSMGNCTSPGCDYYCVRNLQ